LEYEVPVMNQMIYVHFTGCCRLNSLIANGGESWALDSNIILLDDATPAGSPRTAGLPREFAEVALRDTTAS
jgi:hypothetical protein